ncbi:putative RNA methyltransferase [Neobacillus mesonae]|uniref:putative RNA methyltransferase n=1 Tax=Neobacillus mesonae TaxID=1193713 RepID=UPI00203E3D32|nr:methyltransferase domain-containing protein [Neobacillus mesonae]MCM3570481.1 methyltransferase domain-containing protein [Neobacillus mesonae]
MTNKEKSAELVSKYVHIFSCPLCNSPMIFANLKSLVCSNNHTFDFAKQGYVNMMTRSTNSHYDKKIFEARNRIIMESGLYILLHEKISEVIDENMNASNDKIMILDAGCGEGSHLQRILDECKNEIIAGIGLDISKEGIRMAARNYKKSIWLVGDLANSPLQDQSCHIILNILSPANYKEFQRISVPNGLIIKVVPRSNYLKELREARFDEKDKTSYKNDETVSLFKQHFHLMDTFEISYTRGLNEKDLTNLTQMSPLSWNMSKDDMEQIINRGISRITIDLDILVGINKSNKTNERPN